MSFFVNFKKNGNYPLTSKNKSNNIDVYPEHNVILSVTKNLFFRSFTSLRMTKPMKEYYTKILRYVQDDKVYKTIRGQRIGADLEY